MHVRVHIGCILIPAETCVIANDILSPKVFSYALCPQPVHPLLQKEVNNIKRHFGMRYLTSLGKALYPALYPILGIWFFIIHPTFWSLFKTRLLPLLFVSLLVYTLLFMFTFLPQAAFLAIFHGPAAFVSAAFLVLGEGRLVYLSWEV